MIVIMMLTGGAQNYYAPQMFQELGMSSTKSSLFATGIYGVVKVVACLAFLIFAADSLGRRKSLLWTSIAMSISMFVIGAYMYVSPPIEGHPVSFPAAAAVTTTATAAAHNGLGTLLRPVRLRLTEREPSRHTDPSLRFRGARVHIPVCGVGFSRPAHQPGSSR